MNRRNFFLNTAALGGVALLAQLPFKSKAADGEMVIVSETISANHGHQVGLDMADLINLLRQTKLTGSVTLDIQGASGHPHSIELIHEQLIDLFVDGNLVVISSKDAGHIHNVELIVDVIVEESEPIS